MAQKYLCGDFSCSTEPNNVTLSIIHEAFPNASLVPLEGTGHSIFIVTTGLIEIITQTISATVLHAVKSYNTIQNVNSQNYLPDGLAFPEWINLIRCANDVSQTRRGGIKPSNEARELINISSMQEVELWTFFFIHELSHMYKGQSCGVETDTIDPVEIEKLCDQRAYSHIPTTFKKLLPVNLINWMVTMHYSDKVVEKEHYNVKATGKGLTSLYPARNWLQRARGIVNLWKNDAENFPKDYPEIILILDAETYLNEAELSITCTNNP